MDCMQEWADRVCETQLEKILELGEHLVGLPPDEKPFRMTMAASQLAGEGVARSQEEAFVMLTDACVHAEVFKLMDQYDDMLRQMDRHMDRMMKYINQLEKDNRNLKAKIVVHNLKQKENV